MEKLLLFFDLTEKHLQETGWHIKDKVFCTSGILPAAFFLMAKRQGAVSTSSELRKAGINTIYSTYLPKKD